MPENNSQKSKETREEKNRRTNRDMFFALELVSKLGITIALIAGSFVLAGVYLDKRFPSGYPIFTILSLALSIIVSIYSIYWMLEPVIGSEKRKNFLRRKKKQK